MAKDLEPCMLCGLAPCECAGPAKAALKRKAKPKVKVAAPPVQDKVAPPPRKTPQIKVQTVQDAPDLEPDLRGKAVEVRAQVRHSISDRKARENIREATRVLLFAGMIDNAEVTRLGLRSDRPEPTGTLLDPTESEQDGHTRRD